MAEILYCAYCGAQLLSESDIGMEIMITITRPNVAGVKAAGAETTYHLSHLCVECSEDDEAKDEVFHG